MENIRSRTGWLIFIVLAGLAAIIIGRQWLFVEAACSRLQDALLFSATGLIVILIGLYAITTRNDSFLSQMRTIGIVFAVGLIAPALFGPLLSQSPDVRAGFCATCDQLVARAEELRLAAEKDSAQQEKLGKLKSAEFFVRQCVEQSDIHARTQARRTLSRVLFDKAEVFLASTSTNCPEAKTALDEAQKLASEYGTPEFELAVKERQEKHRLTCSTPFPTPPPTRTPTPTSTFTPTPTFTPTRTPTPLPTLTPVPPETPKPDKPCEPITTYLPAVITVLTLEIPQVGPKDQAAGVFYRSEEIPVAYQFKGDERVCLASTRDGRGALRVDDRLDFYVYADGSLTGKWGYDFYDQKTKGIQPAFRPEDVSSLFRAGRYSVKLVLTDLHPQYYSSTAVYLVIWELRR